MLCKSMPDSMGVSQDEFQNDVTRLGAFHTIPVSVVSMFKMYVDAGLTDLITESGIVATGSLQGDITSHHYTRAARTLKIVYVAVS